MSQSLRARYDAEAATYNRTRFGDRRGALARRIKDDAICAILQRRGLLRPGTRILDAATGTGRLLAALDPTPVHLVGADISRGMLDQCRATVGGRATLAQGDLVDLAFRDATFDAALLGGFLYLIPAAAYATYTNDLARVLAPGGLLLCEVANTKTALNPVNMVRIACYRRRHAVKSYVSARDCAALFPAFTCEEVIGVEYPVWCGPKLARWMGERPVLRGIGGKYIAVLRRR